MENDSLLEAFVQADGEGRLALVKANKPGPGFSEQFFYRVARLMGENPHSARELAEAWDIVSRYGDDPSFAWRAKGAYDRLRGDWLGSAKAFVKSGSLARNPIEQLSFQTGAIDSFARAGKTADAVRLGKTIATKLQSGNELGLAGRAWLNTGNANLWADRHKDARKCFDLALACLEGTSFGLEAASARLGSSSAALYIELPSRSLLLAEQARDEMLALGATAYANHARVNTGQCHLLMGRADEAVRIFSELRELADPASLEFARLGQFLGDAWLTLQVYDAASDAFRSAIESPGIKQSPLNHANCLVGLGDVHLAQEDAKQARSLYSKASKLYRKFGNLALDNLAQIGMAKADIELRRLTSATRILIQSSRDLKVRKMHQYEVDALLELASIARSPAEAISTAREALRVIQRYGFVGDLWRVYAIRANWSETKAKALHEYRKMVSAILLHRARLSSITARTTLLEPCLRSIRSYLELLLETNTRSLTQEALRVITELRSVTLIDEFMLASGDKLPDSARSVLSQIRQEVTTEGSGQLPGGPLRLGGKGVWTKPKLLRQYLEQVGLERIEIEPNRVTQQNENAVHAFVFLNQDSAWISNNQSLRCAIDRDDIVRKLGWAYFELLAPLSGFLSDEARLESELKTLRNDLLIDQLTSDGDQLHLSLEGVAYQVPWPLLTSFEPVLHLRPSIGACPSQTFLGPEPKIAIWYHARKDLPHIEKEVEQIRTMFPYAKVFTTTREILDGAHQGSYDLVHVAAHGRYDNENPMFSSIELADGHLLACDIARTPFQTRIATLASCDSAALGQPAGWEPQGLARAFLARKSEVVLGSLWPLNDQAAEYGFGTFYRKLQEGDSVCSALMQTRSDLKVKFSHPAYWGSLVMFGGYTS